MKLVGLLDAVEETGQADNTMIIFVYGDNGTSSEGGMNGMFSEMTYFNGVQETVEDMLKKFDKWGSPETYPHMAAGWAVMFDTPLSVDQASRLRSMVEPKWVWPSAGPKASKPMVVYVRSLAM